MEKSLPWEGTATGDAGGYSANQWDDVWEALFIGNSAATRGVFLNFLNELAVTVTGALEVTVASGAALVKGKYYRNTAPVAVVIGARGDSTRYDRIVLQASWAAQTIRIVKKAGTAGQVVVPLVQVDGSMWEIPLATVTIPPSTSPGTPITVADERLWLRYSTKVNGGSLNTVKGLVTNGDNHDHVGGDGAALAINQLVAGAVTSVAGRNGGSATNWATGGDVGYDLSGTKIRLQAGAVRVPASPSGIYGTSVHFFFPTPFKSGTRPLVIAFMHVSGLSIPFSATCEVYSHEDATIFMNMMINSQPIYATDINWLAIGEE